MNFQLAESIFFFTIRVSKSLIDYFKPKPSVEMTGPEILLTKTAKIASIIDEIYKDNKVDLSDMPEIINALKEAAAFIGFDFEGAAIQIANASGQELNEAFKKFDSEFVLIDKNKEAHLEIIFHEIFNVINSVNRIMKICGKIQK